MLLLTVVEVFLRNLNFFEHSLLVCMKFRKSEVLISVLLFLQLDILDQYFLVKKLQDGNDMFVSALLGCLDKRFNPIHSKTGITTQIKL